VPLTAIHAARVLTPLAEIPNALILVEDGKIRSVGPRAEGALPPGTREFDARGLTAVPGFVDVHVHGAAGRDVMEGTAEALAAVACCLAKHGTTSFLATTVSAGVEGTLRGLEGLAGAIRAQSHGGGAVRAECVGIHLEGPFLSAARRGVHPEEALVAPSPATLARFLAAAQGFARMLTIAPELPGAEETIAAAREAGLVVAMGHTDATYDAAVRAIELGARHAVHVFNAMRPFSHRETGVLGAVLTDPRVSAEVIADGVHVDEPALRLLLTAKSAEHVVLVSDGTAATDMPDGEYRLGGIEVKVSAGVSRNKEGRIAGSTLTLERAVRRMAAMGVPTATAVQMATLNASRVVGMEGRKGVLARGADADVVLVDNEMNVKRVFVGGREVGA